MNLKKADLIICLNLIEHLKDDYRLNFMQKIIPSILNRNGFVVFSLYKQYNFFNIVNMLFHRGCFFDPTHIYNWTEKQFEVEISKHFKIIKILNVAGYTKLTSITKYAKTETLIIAKLKK